MPENDLRKARFTSAHSEGSQVFTTEETMAEWPGSWSCSICGQGAEMNADTQWGPQDIPQTGDPDVTRDLFPR